jgi:hypothetical protein
MVEYKYLNAPTKPLTKIKNDNMFVKVKKFIIAHINLKDILPYQF